MHIRELNLDDYPAIQALNARNGLRTPDEAEWSRLWIENPHDREFADVPMGWVMEEGGGPRAESRERRADGPPPSARIVGAACNVPVMYDLGGRAIRTTTGMAWAVDVEYRDASLLLLDAFFKQSRCGEGAQGATVDLLLNTTANPVAGKAWQAFKAERLPCESYDRNMMWITRYQRFAKSATRRLGWRGARLLQIPVAGALAGQDMWRRVRSWGRPRGAASAAVERLDGFTAQFDELWQDICLRGETKLRASRQAASLDWHFGRSLQREEVFILGCPGDDGASLDGYLIARRNDRAEIGLRRFQVADLQVRPGREHVVPQLVAEALRVARTEKAAAVELTGFEPTKHRLAANIPHRVRRLPTWPFFYKSLNDDLREELRNPGIWDPSPFDGDATL